MIASAGAERARRRVYGCLTLFLYRFVVLIVSFAAGVAVADPAPTLFFDIPRQPLAGALLDFSYQSRVQVLVPGAVTDGLIAGPLRGRYTPREALARLLANTGLVFDFLDPQTVTVKPAADRRRWAARRRRDEGLPIEQILVTSSGPYRPERALSLSRSAFDGEELEARGVRRTEDLVPFVPGLTVLAGERGRTAIGLRGVVRGGDDLGLEPALGVYLDGVPLVRGGPANTALYELDRVDVLRDDQALRYGPLAAGGVLLYATRPAARTPAGSALWAVGGRGVVDTVVSVEGALGERIAGRFAVARFAHGAFSDNLVAGAVADDAADGRAARLTLDGVLGEWAWQFAADAERARQTAVLYSIRPGAGFRYAEGQALEPPSTPERTARVDGAGPERLDQHGWRFTLRRDGPEQGQRLTFAVRGHRLQGRYDLDQSAVALAVKTHAEQSDGALFDWQAWAAPGRGAAWWWQVGLRLARDEGRVDKALGLAGFDLGETRWHQHLRREQGWLWGHVARRLGARLEATFGAGLGVIAQHWAVDAAGSAASAGHPLLQESAFTFGDSRRDRSDAARLSLTWRPGEDWAGYLAVGESRRPPVYPGTPARAALAGRILPDERRTSTEAGLQAALFARRIKINVGAYRDRYDDLRSVPWDRWGLNRPVVLEAARVTGVELEIQARPLPALGVALSAALQDAVADGGPRLPYAPRAALALSLRYLFADGPDGAWGMRVDASRIGAAEDGAGGTAWPEQRRFDLWLDYRPHDARWSLAVWARNALDAAVYFDRAPGLGPSPAARLEPPRLLGSTWTYHW
ncbi:MAG: hypothetical protein KatS3mg121_0447 [Gammaproteobacteria bacterium]|nr:MAG: hypothetical protein KatS3mg121_0447 [Gammaproteobacteria bacterium]